MFLQSLTSVMEEMGQEHGIESPDMSPFSPGCPLQGLAGRSGTDQ